MVKHFYTGLDIGSTKIACVIGERDDLGALRVIGAGASVSDGLRRGAVVNLEKTVAAITRAVEEAERTAGVNVRSVVAGIAGDHIRSLNGRGTVGVSGRNNEITPQDVARVIEATKSLTIPADREIIHAIPQEFIVDDQDGIRDPIGMPGVRLEATLHLITAAASTARNIAQAVHKAGLKLDDLVLEPLASANAVLGSDEKELGVVLLDIGGGTTGLVMYSDAVLRHTSVIGFGGSHITSDIAMCLHTQLDCAEKLKIEHGIAHPSMARGEATIMVPGIGGRAAREIPRTELTQLIEPRVEEILTLVEKEMRRVHSTSLLGAGMVITGGTADLRGITELAEEMFKLPVRRGVPHGIQDLADPLTSPRYATAVGLMMHAFENEGLHANGHRNVFGKMRDRVGQLIGSFTN